MKFFNNLKKTIFIDRPNRFLLNCKFEEKNINVFLPNPGRLQELLFPGTTVYVTSDNYNESRKTKYTAVFIIKDNIPVMVHTHKSNEIVKYLIEKKLVPSLENATVISSEITCGKSRFDFLLRQGMEELYLEVKSCTLFGEKICMFPDAITERGRKHLKELSHMAETNIKTCVLFLVHCYRAEYFLPDYHTDLLFGQTFLECNNVNIIPLAIEWKEDLSFSGKTKILTVPRKVIEQEAKDRGSYMILMELKEKKHIGRGKLGKILFEPAFYVYTGSAMANLTQRINRHRRLRKNYHWHIDYFREHAGIIADFPVRSSEDLECNLAETISKIADFSVKNFGSSDCKCESHLFGFRKNPLLMKEFIKVIQYFRIDRLETVISEQ